MILLAMKHIPLVYVLSTVVALISGGRVAACDFRFPLLLLSQTMTSIVTRTRIMVAAKTAKPVMLPELELPSPG